MEVPRIVINILAIYAGATSAFLLVHYGVLPVMGNIV